MTKPPSEMTDRELDEAVAVEVMGAEVGTTRPSREFHIIVRPPYPSLVCRGQGSAFSPSTNIVNAMEVVGQFHNDRRRVQMHNLPYTGDNFWMVRIHACAGDNFAESVDASLPRAICEAAILAIRERAK